MTEPQADYRKRIKSDYISAEAYTRRKQHKHNAEMRVIRRALKHTNGVKTFLDIPCGAGRATILLAKAGFNATGADLGHAMTAVARQKIKEAGVTAAIEQTDIEQMHYANASFDAILCFRLYHHFPNDEVREKVISELCRVAKNYVLISYLSPYSLTSMRRRLRAILGKKKSRQNATSLAKMAGFFAQQGYYLVKDIPQFRFFHTLHLAVFVKNQ